MKWINVSLLFLLAVLISACDSQQPTYSASNANTAPPPPPPVAPVAEAPKPAEPPVQPPPAQPKPETGRPRAAVPANSLVRARPMPVQPEPLPPVDAFGIGGCDDYINRYRTCVNTGVANNTIPLSRRTKLVKGLNVQVRQWRADVASGKSNGLVTACAEADKNARPELVKVGCSSF